MKTGLNKRQKTTAIYFDEYVTAEIVMVGTFGGKTELFHHLNEHSPYTRENALREFGAVDDRRFPLE